MRRLVISLVAAVLLLVPASSYAGSGHGGHGGRGHGGSFHGHGFHGHGFHGRGFVVVGPGCCWGPWWWGIPPYSYPPPIYYVPPAATVSVAPAQPTQNVVQFATGRYELRGDGVSMPYRWVWIPNPPTAPPPAAPAGSRPVASAR